MDKERKKRLQTWKVILADTLIVLAVVFIVTFLSLIAMGYKINDDGGLDQSGLLQINSEPTGATVAIDGEEMFLRTNMNHMLPEGEHQVELTKEGYELWRGKVDISSGLLYKLDYPRLFKQGRKAETVAKFAQGLAFLSAAPDRKKILYQEVGATELVVMNTADETEVEKIDVSGVPGVLSEVIWAENGEIVLTKWDNSGIIEYRMVDLRQPEQILDVNQEFGLEFTKMLFAGPEQLYGLENGNLRKISVGTKELSRVLLSGVADFENEGTNIMYVTAPNEAGEKEIGFYQEGGKGVSLLSTTAEARVLVSEYLGKKYLGIITDEKMMIYKGGFPTASRGLKRMQQILAEKIGMTPSEFYARAEGRLIVAQNGPRLAVMDAEREKVFSFEASGARISWLDDFLVGSIDDKGLYVQDFDGTNRRKLANSATLGDGLGIDSVISGNNKWLYYVSGDGLKLKREEL